jgi:arsenate reductase (glutaredoxin)
VILWHNPGCGTSRNVLAALEARKIKPTVRLYLKDPPSKAELQDVLAKAGLKAIDLLRKTEADAAGITTNAQALAAMVANPKLIQRPVLIDGDRALLARPPSVLEGWL